MLQQAVGGRQTNDMICNMYVMCIEAGSIEDGI